MRSNLKNAPRDHNRLGYFDPRSHRRSLEVTRGQKEVKIEKCNQGPICLHMISPINIGYKNFDPRNHQRSLEVTGCQNEVKFEKYTQGPNFWHAYPCDIPDLHKLWHFDPKIDKRSTEVTRGQNEIKFDKYT